jgi:hypothetical protein
MKYRLGRHGFFAAVRPWTAALMMSAALPACTTASIDDVAPVAPTSSTLSTATAPEPTPRPDEAEPALTEQALAPAEGDTAAIDAVAGPRNSGRYPNLNVTPGTAAPQITPEEKAAMLKELQAKQKGVADAAAKAKPADQVEALRELGARHGADALKEIEEKSE